MPSEVTQLEGGGIRIHGWVPQTEPFLDAARLSVAPLRFGAGVKGKVGEAWARGLPVAGTSVAFEGMTLPGSPAFLAADTPKSLAALIDTIYRDKSAWLQARESGRSAIAARFSPDVARVAIERVLSTASHARNDDDPSHALLARQITPQLLDRMALLKLAHAGS